MTGIGYTYPDGAAATIIERMLAETIAGVDAMQTAACSPPCWRRIAWPSGRLWEASG